MKKIPKITVRIGAAHDSVTVDGTTFDRSRMARPERNKMTRMIVGALTNVGFFEVAA
jgi:3-polyprenyl-4-hydroxybenzoate decarboxylase